MPSQNFQEKYESLPEDLKQALFDDQVSEKITEIGLSNDVDENLIEEFLKIIGKVFLGALPIQNLAVELIDILDLKTFAAQQIVRKLEINVFSKYKESLDKIYPKSLLELTRKKQLLKQQYRQILEEKKEGEGKENLSKPAYQKQKEEPEKTVKPDQEDLKSQDLTWASAQLTEMKKQNHGKPAEENHKNQSVFENSSLEGKNLIKKIAEEKEDVKNESKPKTQEPIKIKKTIEDLKKKKEAVKGKIEKKKELFKKGPDKYREAIENFEEDGEEIKATGVVREEDGKVKTIL